MLSLLELDYQTAFTLLSHKMHALKQRYIYIYVNVQYMYVSKTRMKC